jgi:hypothetical protein
MGRTTSDLWPRLLLFHLVYPELELSPQTRFVNDRVLIIAEGSSCETV